jgi:hypothetical protein
MQWLAVLFKAHITKLIEDQFLTALAWVIAALQDADDPRMRVQEKGCSPRKTQDKNVDCYRIRLFKSRR